MNFFYNGLSDIDETNREFLKEQLARYEQLQQTLQSFLVQKQQIEVEIVEIDKALSELNKANEKSKVYKSAGTVMISSNKEDVEKDLDKIMVRFDRVENKLDSLIERINK